MFTAALFITANTWKQLKCTSVGEWKSKLWYIQTMEYYVVKRYMHPNVHSSTSYNSQDMEANLNVHPQVNG